jgi:predicted Zn-dependent peptidase
MLPCFQFVPIKGDMFSIQIYFPVGSVDETAGEYGISHFIEHMKFKRSKRSNGRDLLSRLDKLGCIYNAYTTKDHTSYYIKSIASIYRDVIDIFFQIVFETIFRRNDIDTERNVILEEYFKTYDGAQHGGMVDEAMASVLHPSNPYHLPIIGTLRDLKNMSNAQLARFHKRHYRNSYAVTVACPSALFSDIKKEVRKNARHAQQQFLNCLPNHAASLPRSNLLAKMQYSIVVERHPLHQYTTVMTYGCYPKRDPRSLYSEFLAFILSQGLQSVLIQEIRERQGLVYNINTMYNGYRDIGMFMIMFASSFKHTDFLIHQVLQTIAQLKNTMTASYFRSLKKAYLNALQLKLSGVNAKTEFIGLEHFYRPTFSVDKYIHDIEEMSKERFINEVASITDPSKIGVTTYGNYDDTERMLDEIHTTLELFKKT